MNILVLASTVNNETGPYEESRSPSRECGGAAGWIFYDVLVTVQAGLSYCEFYDWRRICAG